MVVTICVVSTNIAYIFHINVKLNFFIMKTNATSMFIKMLFVSFCVLFVFDSCTTTPAYTVDYPETVEQGGKFTANYVITGANNSDPTVFFAGIMLPDGWTVDGDSLIGKIIYNENELGEIPEPRIGFMYRSNSGEIINKEENKPDYLNNYEALLNKEGTEYPALDGYSWSGFRSLDTIPCPESAVKHIECSITINVPADANIDFYDIQTLFSEQSSLTTSFDKAVVGDCYQPNIFIEVIEGSGANVGKIKASEVFSIANLSGGRVIVDLLNESMLHSVLNVRDINGRIITNTTLDKSVTVIDKALPAGTYIISLEKGTENYHQKFLVK